MREKAGELGMPPVETIADLEGVPIHDNGEPLVDLRSACPSILVGEQPLFARQGVALRLNVVQEWLDVHHPGCRLRVGDAYRSPAHQARLFGWALRVARLLHPLRSASQVREAANRYVAAPDALAPAPHTTGGAVDVGLVDREGRRAYMGPFVPAATRTDYTRLNALATRNRAILCAAMRQGGFSNYRWNGGTGRMGTAAGPFAPTRLWPSTAWPNSCLHRTGLACIVLALVVSAAFGRFERPDTARLPAPKNVRREFLHFQFVQDQK